MFGTQTNETISSNVKNWNDLHGNVSCDKGRREYDAERMKKHRIRMIEAWRKAGRK